MSVWTPDKACPQKAPLHRFPSLTPQARARAPCEPVHTEMPTEGCTQRHGLSPLLSERAVPGARGAHSFMGLVLRWDGWWKRSLTAGRGASLLPVLQPARGRNAWHRSSAQTGQCCRQVGCQDRKCFTIQNVLWKARNWHLLIIMKLGNYIDNVSHAAVCFAKSVAHVTYTRTQTHAWGEGLLSHFPFPNFSKLILLEMHTS